MSLNDSPVARPPRMALLGALAVSTVVVVADIFIGRSPAPDLSTAYGMGYVVGTCLGAMLFVGGVAYAILHFTALRGDNRRHRLAYAAILFGWCLLVSAGAVLFLRPAQSPPPAPSALDLPTTPKTPG